MANGAKKKPILSADQKEKILVQRKAKKLSSYYDPIDMVVPKLPMLIDIDTIEC